MKMRAGGAAVIAALSFWQVSSVDTFQRSNGALTTPWAAVTGSSANLTISSDTVITSNLASGTRYLNSSATWSNDQFSFLQILTPNANGVLTGYGPSVRNSGTLNFYFIGCNGSGSQIEKDIAGTETNLLFMSGKTCANGDLIGISVAGTTITAYKNFAPIGTVTDTSLASGSPGMEYQATDVSGAGVGEWFAGNFAAGGGSSPQSTLSYMQGLGTSGNVLSGQHGDYYSGSTLANAYDQMGGTTAATLNIHADSGDGGAATGQVTAIIGVSMGNGTPGAIAGGSGSFSTVYGGSGINMNGLGVAQDWKTNNPSGIVALSSWFADPATGLLSSTPNVAAILTSGTTQNTTFLSYVDSLASLIKQIPGSVLYRPFVENNLNGETYGPSHATAAQQQQLFQLVHNRMVGAPNNVTNVLWVYNINDSFGGSPPTSSFLTSYPGSAYVDVVSWDAYSTAPGTNAASTGVYTQLLTLGKPIIIFEGGAGGNNTAGIYNNYTYFTDLMTHCPKVVAVIYWTQNWALSLQAGANSLLTAPTIINLSALPPLTMLMPQPAANDDYFVPEPLRRVA